VPAGALSHACLLLVLPKLSFLLLAREIMSVLQQPFVILELLFVSFEQQ